MKKKTLYLIPSIVGSLFISANPGWVNAAEPVSLESITVKGEGMRDADRSFSVNVISQDSIQEQHWENPLTIVEEAAGFNAVAYQHGGVADVFTIRGFTGGGHGSDAGLSLDGISLNEGESHADGYGDTSIIIPLELESVSVYKGPVSPLYGNFARGGVLAFTTRKGGEYQNYDMSTGSYGTFDAQAAFGTQAGPLQINGAMQGYESEGWRDHSRYTKMNAAFRGAYDISDRSEVAFSLRGHGGTWKGPNYILNDQFEDDDTRRQENPFTKLQDDTGEKRLNAQRVDFSHLINDKLKLLAHAYRNDSFFVRFQTRLNAANAAVADPNDPNLNLTAVAPQTEYNHDRDASAIGTSLNGTHPLFGLPSSWVLGFEYYDEDTRNFEWRTVTHVRQSLLQRSDFEINSTSLYGQMDLDVNPRFRPTLGFRYDSFDGSQDNLLTSTTTDMNDYDHLSPKLGLRSALTDNWELRASAANGFALPSGTAKYDPNIDVDTVEFWQYEIGINGAPSPQWYVDLAAFILNTTDDIVTDPNNTANFINAGETQRDGIEGEIRFYPESYDHVEAFTAFAFYGSEIEKNPNAALVGKELTSLPKHVANIGVRYSPPTGWGGSIRLRSVGEWYTNAANTITYDGYDVVNATVTYTMRQDDEGSARWYLDINNLTDEVYSENVTGGPHPTQGNVPTSYSPRPPTNIMVGIALTL
ncbi:MAG: TonB-dependent receptor [Acetobacteraceae bacterium]|uniref:TonB-dependent receptor n=1 Tax=Bradyrhizobium sp. TaxID=376 RepID=UPI003D0A4573